MRSIRIAVLGALMIAGVVVVPAMASAAPPAPPYNDWTLNGGQGSYLLAPGEAFRWTPTTGMTEGAYGTSGLEFSGPGALTIWTALIAAPTGGLLHVGTYTTQRGADATHIGLDIDGDGRGCNQDSGTLDIEQVTYDDSNAITAFAASFSQQCEGTEFPATGEFRFNSTVVPGPAASSSPGRLDFGTLPVGLPSTKTITVNSNGGSDEHFGTATITGSADFAITQDTCSDKTLPTGTSCVIGVTVTPSSTTVSIATLALADASAAFVVSATLSVTGKIGSKGTYYPLAPDRLLDTRKSGSHPLGSGATTQLQISGLGGVPASGASAVVLNLTVTGATAGGYMTVYPTGGSLPTASSINFKRGQTLANGLTVKLGPTGKISIFNAQGTANVIVDVVGYYRGDDGAASIGGAYQPFTTPQRMLDTRPSGAIPGHEAITTWLNLNDGDDYNAHVRAFAVNITTTGATAGGFLTVWDGISNTVPTASTLNFVPGVSVANSAIQKTAPCGSVVNCGSDAPSITIYNGSPGSVQIIVDIVGFYDDSTTPGGGLRFVPTAPSRIVDTRIGKGASGPIGDGRTTTFTAPSTVVDADTVALQTNVTAVAPTKSTYLTVWPEIPNTPTPNVSSLNPAAGQNVANGVTTVIGPTGGFNIFNAHGSVNVIVDVNGLFDYFPYSLPSAAIGINAKVSTAVRIAGHASAGHSGARIIN